MIKRALLLLLLTAVWAFGSWWYYTCMIKGFCKTDGAFTSASDRAKAAAATGAAAIATTATGLANGEPADSEAAATDAAESDDDKTAASDSEPAESAEDKTDTNDSAETPEKPTAPATTSEFVDQDNDAISDEDERRLGTDPAKDDSDGDGLKDNEELGEDLQSPIDTDGDGIIDALDDDDDDDTLPTAKEIDLGTDPRNADTDDDALNDALETSDKIGTDPLKADTDSDGISDGSEVGSDPNQPMDTDKDGMIDALDTDDDEDGIPTAVEIKVNSDPLSKDSDGDGVSDGDELGDNPDQPKDSDGDGIVDIIDADSGDASTPEKSAPDDTEEQEDSNPSSEDAVTVDQSDNSGSADNSAGDIPIQKSRLYFPSSSSNPGLSDAATKYFKEVANWLNASPTHTVVLTGHTDNVGKAKNNLDLGLKRAVEIKNMMVKLGANESQIDVASMGETQPIASNKTDKGRRQNRRVELIPALKQ